MRSFRFSLIIIATIYSVVSLVAASSWPWTTKRPSLRKSWRFSYDSATNSSSSHSTQQEALIHRCLISSAECHTHFSKFTDSDRLSYSPIETFDIPEDNTSGEGKSTTQSFSETLAKGKPEKLENLLENQLRDTYNNLTSQLMNPTQFNKKLLQLEPDYGSLNSISNSNDTEKRVIAYKIPAKNATSTRQKYPTITLAEIARKLLFPDWLWSRLGSNRKIGVGGVNVTTTLKGAAGMPVIANGKIPSITFDNNFSRFLKLFTMVRFQNVPCMSPTGQNGTCFHATECTNLGGVPSAPCASGFGVCCVFRQSCGSVVRANETYFVDGGMVFSPTGVSTCTIEVRKISPIIKQMRLDFEVFSLLQPNAGNCDTDRFVVSGQNINNVIPIICGVNNGSHLYVETEGSGSGIQLSVMTTGEGSRNWRIRITQFETINPSSAPSHCLQYQTGAMGTINSFNYNAPTSPQYLNNLNYAICIRKEAGFCSVTFTNAGPDGTYMPFQIVNANENGNLVIPGGQAGVGLRDCPYDFILINGYRLCGERFNDATTNVLFVEDAPVTDVSNGPFIVTVRTNELDVGGGFFLNWRQNPCMSNPG